VWGAWLTMIAPSAAFLPALTEARGHWPHNDWLVECAIASVRGRAQAAEVAPVAALSNPLLSKIEALATRCAALLRDVKRPAVRLRCAPSETQVAQMNHERELIRHAYMSGGIASARAALAGTQLAL
jgi:hypothetical protein